MVQRHRARRRHYDLRLEVDGVLASWAVPRGPTLDADVRRMAVRVDDHPMQYYDFEGVIPSGQYGAGDVIVWDWGTWEPEQETPDPRAPDPRSAIAAGELKFVLHGERLRGRFVLVRTSGRAGVGASGESGQDQWLLIHKHDEHAVSGWDADDHPRSVRSGLTNDEVKAAPPAIWDGRAPVDDARIDLSAAEPAQLPRFVPPMLATLAADVPTGDDWLNEVKWDGFRVQAVVGPDRVVRLWTRNGNDADAYFPGLLTPPDWIDAHDAVVDGEVVAFDASGRPDFGLLQERISDYRGGGRAGLVYQAFDLLHLDGRSLLAVPLEDRKKLLRLVLRPTSQAGASHVRFAEHIVGDGPAVLAAAAEQGLEGVVAKRRRSRYEPGRRSDSWLKVKVRPEQELVVGGWTPQRSGAARIGALVVGYYAQGRLRYAGKVGSGIDQRSADRLAALLEPLQIPDPAFDPPPPTDARGRWGSLLAGVTWVRPEVVVRVQLGGWSRDGLVRQASFHGIEPDRDPRAVVREEALDLPAESGDADPAPVDLAGVDLAGLAALGAAGTWNVGGQDVRLTNLDKVLFAGRDGEVPLTKRDLVGYFAQVAPVLLPHLAGRPLNLHRFPNGAGAAGFWQKDLPSSAPAWLTRWHEPDSAERRGNTHLVADRPASVVWLANQAAFEIHAWTSTCADPEHPTFALIDIDPGTSTTWEETLVLARLFRTALDHLGVRGYPKTTGSRGVQVWIPVEPGRYTFAETSAWVERLSRAVGATVPELVSWEWSKAERGGRARLDFTQNAPIKTLVAPYAVRPAAGAPVSTPIAWEELDDPQLRSDRWTIREVPARVQTVGDLFADAQSDFQVLPPL